MVSRLALILCAVAACSRPIQRARTTVTAPPSPAEIEAADKIANRACSPYWSFLFPGIGQACTGEPAEGAAMIGLGAAEIGAGVYAITEVELDPADEELEHPAIGIPFIAFQDLYVYSASDIMISRNLALRQLYTPADSTADLLAAPFNLQVMKDPKVWGGLLGALAIGVGLSFAIDDELDTDNLGGDPNIFGRTFDPATGYPLGLGIFGGLFTHVGMAEEALFRGVLQSGLARTYGETGGLIGGSLIFGIAHAPNALALEGDERRDYLLYAVPTITLLGTYLSWMYKDAGYSLAPSTALHFWYDFLLSAAVFVAAPDVSPLAASVRFSL
jgi:membrane protease YdiL (CAAX protease family)